MRCLTSAEHLARAAQHDGIALVILSQVIKALFELTAMHLT